MGLTFAKSVKFGAVRFNFSGSGIGMSVGIPGLRIGTGPRGAYVGGGMGGFRYRKSLAGPARPTTAPTPTQSTQPGVPIAPQSNITSTVEHEAKGVLELTDSNSDSLIQSMNEQRQKTNRWPFAAVLLALVLWVLGVNSERWPAFLMPTLVVASIALVIWLSWRDKMRKLTVLFFEPDNETASQFEAIIHGAQAAASSKKLQAVAATSAYSDTKYSAGASSALKLVKGSLSLGQAPGVAANIEAPILQATKLTLAFFPDRVLVFQGKVVGAINYNELEVKNSPVTFVESGTVPSDATVTGKTWQYVNKKGGPDKRFKNNREMPLCRYDELRLITGKGLDIYLMCSREGGFKEFVEVLNKRKASA